MQEPSSLQATEALAANIGDVSVSRSLQRNHLYFSRDNSVSVELLRRLVSFSVPSLTMELERAQMQVSAQSDKSAMFQIVSEDCKENIHKQVSKT